MAARPVWQGYIRFSLVNIPAQGFATTAAGGEGGQVHLHQLHKDCGARVRYEKVCPVHGKINASEIESGYEFAKDQYVTVDADTLSGLRKGNDKTIGIEAFIPRGCIAPRFFSGRTMYLLPEGPVGTKSFAMLHQLLVEQKRYAFCTAVMNSKEQMMLVRPVDKLLSAEFLKYAEEVKPPSELSPRVGDVAVPKKELDLARTLFNQLSDDAFELAKFSNTYAADLRKLIDAKVAGQEVVVPPEESEAPQVTDLMAALRKSLEQAKAKASDDAKPAARPHRITRPGTAGKAAAVKPTRARRRA